MKIVNIIGGLGNQMFQYAFALRLQHQYPNEKVLLDKSHFHYIFLRKWHAANLHNGFELYKIFPNCRLKVASPIDLLRVSYYVPNFWLSRVVRKILPKRNSEYIQANEMANSFSPDVFTCEGNMYYEGYWQSVSYLLPVQDIVKEAFQHPLPNAINAKYIQEIQSTNSIGIHIRRGDYLNSETFKGICDLSYYKLAIEKLLEDAKPHTFFIFSNDMKWCKENICPLLQNNPYRLISENKGKDSCWDMFLMTYCKDLIIANSSFSWWGAFLKRKDGNVISPSKWTNNDKDYDIWVPNWIRL